MFFIGLLILCCVLTAIYRFKLFKVGLRIGRLRISTLDFKESFLILGGILLLRFWSISLGSLFGYIIFNRRISLLCVEEKVVGLVIVLVGISSGFIFI